MTRDYGEKFLQSHSREWITSKGEVIRLDVLQPFSRGAYEVNPCLVDS